MFSDNPESHPGMVTNKVSNIYAYIDDCWNDLKSYVLHGEDLLLSGEGISILPKHALKKLINF